MKKTININQKYSFKYLEKPFLVQKGQLRVGYICDNDTKKPILILDVIDNFINDYHQTMITSEELTNSKGDKAILVLVDAMIFHYDFICSDFGYTKLMHELGHYLSEQRINDNYSKIRAHFKGVMPEEYEADEFAVRECGINRFLKTIEHMKNIRMNILRDKNCNKALNEFELRKKHAIEYAKTLEISNHDLL